MWAVTLVLLTAAAGIDTGSTTACDHKCRKTKWFYYYGGPDLGGQCFEYDQSTCFECTRATSSGCTNAPESVGADCGDVEIPLRIRYEDFCGLVCALPPAMEVTQADFISQKEYKNTGVTMHWCIPRKDD